jgi:hypothetical protein
MPEPLRLEIAHTVPGRVRLRCPALREDPSVAGSLQDLADGLPGLERLTVRPTTASVILTYSLEDTTPEAFRKALGARAEVVEPEERTPFAGAPTTHAAPRAEPIGQTLTRELCDLWDRADREVRERTNNHLDVRQSVPWVLFLLGVAQVARSGSLPMLPWYAAIYYSIQAILRYTGQPTELEVAEEIAPAADAPDAAGE